MHSSSTLLSEGNWATPSACPWPQWSLSLSPGLQSEKHLTSFALTVKCNWDVDGSDFLFTYFSCFMWEALFFKEIQNYFQATWIHGTKYHERTTHLAQSHYPAVVGKSGLTELYLTLVFQPWHSALLRSEGQSFGRFIFLTRVLVGRYFSVNWRRQVYR